MKKYLEIDDNDWVWRVPVEKIADHRAKYYVGRDEETTYQEEFDYVMGDDYEAIDWFANNMDFKDVEEFAVLIASPEPKTEPGNEAELRLVDAG